MAPPSSKKAQTRDPAARLITSFFSKRPSAPPAAATSSPSSSAAQSSPAPLEAKGKLSASSRVEEKAASAEVEAAEAAEMGIVSSGQPATDASTHDAMEVDQQAAQAAAVEAGMQVEVPSEADVGAVEEQGGAQAAQEAQDEQGDAIMTDAAPSSQADILPLPPMTPSRSSPRFFASPILDQQPDEPRVLPPMSERRILPPTSERRILPPISAARLVRCTSEVSSSSLSSVPNTPSPQKGKGKARVASSSGDSSEEDEVVVQMLSPAKRKNLAPPTARLRSHSPSEPGAQRFVGVVVPRIPSKPAKKSASRSPAPKPPPSQAKTEGSDSDDLEDADEFMNKLMQATKDTPRAGKGKKVAFADDPAASSSDRVRRSTRADPEPAKKAVPRLFENRSTADRSGKYSLKNLLRSTQAAERSDRAVEAAVAYDLPDELPAHLLGSPGKSSIPHHATRAATPPPGERAADVLTPNESPGKTRIVARDIEELDHAVLAASGDGEGAEKKKGGKDVKKTVQLVKTDAAGGQVSEEKAREEKKARACWKWGAWSEAGEEGWRVKKLDLGGAHEHDEWSVEVLEYLRDGLEEPSHFPVDVFAFAAASLPALTLKLILTTALHPATDRGLGDRILRSLCASRPSFASAEVVCDQVLGAFKELGMKDEFLHHGGDGMEVEEAAGEYEQITMAQCSQTVVRALRVVQWAAALAGDSAAVLFEGLARPLLRLGIDPSSNPIRPTLLATIDAVISPRLRGSPDSRTAVLETYVALAQGRSWQTKREVLRLVPVGSLERQAMRCWLALALLNPDLVDAKADLASRPPASFAHQALCFHGSPPEGQPNLRPNDSDDMVIDCPPSGTSTPVGAQSPELPRSSIARYRPAFNYGAADTDAREGGYAVGILANAVRDVAGYLGLGDAREKTLSKSSDIWLKALQTALAALDSSIRTSVRGDPERNKLKNSITRLNHSLIYQLAWAKEERPDAMKLFLAQGAAQAAASTTFEKRKPARVKSREGSVAAGHARTGSASSSGGDQPAEVETEKGQQGAQLDVIGT